MSFTAMKITTSAFKHFLVISSTQTNIALCFVKHLEFSTKNKMGNFSEWIAKPLSSSCSPILELQVICHLDWGSYISAILTLQDWVLTNHLISVFLPLFTHFLYIGNDLSNNSMTLCCIFNILLKNIHYQMTLRRNCLKSSTAGKLQA